MAQRYFATINPGLEEALLAEVRDLGGKRAEALTGGVEFDATNSVFYRALRELRCANRLWLRLDEFRARDAPELFNKTKRMDWARLIPADTPVAVRGASHHSRLIHTERLSRAVSEAIDASLGRPEGKAKGSPLSILARIVDNRCQLSLDASGELLYRRGWKTNAVAAPMRETIAAAVLRLIDWTPEMPLVDPFCGSGTLVIEAAQRAAGMAAGADRTFDLHRWANFRQDLWDEISAPKERETPAAARFAGSDIEPGAIEAARHNAERAHVADWCSFTVADAKSAEPTDPSTWIVTNPPWNVRLSDPALDALNSLVARRQGSRIAVIAPRRWGGAGGKERTRFELGGTPVALWVFED